MVYKQFKRHCNTCGKYYEGSGKYYCSRKCQSPPMLGKKHKQSSVDKMIKVRNSEDYSPWNKGLTKETDSRIKAYGESISESKKGQHPITEFKKGCIPWNKGLTIEDPRVRKYAESGAISKKGQHSSPETEFKKGCVPIAGFKSGNIPWNLGKPFMQKGDHPNWQGGKSGEGYPRRFNRPYKKLIRIRDSHICQLCGKTQEEQALETTIKFLAVHHIDYNKKNNSPDNLISLCVRCHSKTNYYRRYYEQYFDLIMKERTCQK